MIDESMLLVTHHEECLHCYQFIARNHQMIECMLRHKIPLKLCQ